MDQENSLRLNRLFSPGWLEKLVYFEFWILGVASLFVVTRFDRAYQDKWIGEDIWPLLLGLSILFTWYFTISENVNRMARMAGGMVFFLSVLPAIKYRYVYGSAVDQAHHLSLIRYIQLIGVIEPGSVYRDTPGFHVLVAQFANLSGISPVLASKLVPAILGSFIPFGFYLFCMQTKCTQQQTRWVLFFSGLSAPLLYKLNGSIFSTPLFIIVISLILIREQRHLSKFVRDFYTLLIIIMFIMIIIWHPSTTLVLIAVLIITGVLTSIFGQIDEISSRGSLRFLQLSILLAIGTFTYWMYKADLVWDHFLRNIKLALNVDLTPDLIPTRLFNISFIDQILIGIFYHARDGLLLGLAILGFCLLFIYPQSPENSSKGFHGIASFWLTTLIIVVLVFVVGFGAQGYWRFLVFAISLSPPLAGYAFWKIGDLAKLFSQKAANKVFLLAVLNLIVFVSLLQIYPLQPLIPKMTNPSMTSENGSPIVWLHQVNSEYQYQLIDFAIKQFNPEPQILTDYITHKQTYQFFGLEFYNQVRYFRYQKDEPAYILLHWPGYAGAFSEQAEYRSQIAINSWRYLEQVFTVYDNGGSFILYHQNNPFSPFTLEAYP